MKKNILQICGILTQCYYMNQNFHLSQNIFYWNHLSWMFGMQSWSKIFLMMSLFTVIICWFDKDDLDDFIFNILCEKCVDYVHKLGAPSGDVFVMKAPTLLTHKIVASLTVMVILGNSWSTNTTSFTASDTTTHSA